MNKITICLIVLMSAINAFAVSGDLRPINNTFVLDPGIASPMQDANDSNFGGSGSLCVSSSIARAYDFYDGIDHDPKGEFVTLLKFDSSLCTNTILNKMTLKLAITNGNQSAGGIFNYLGSPGDFDLYWIVNHWQQGYGTSKVLANSDVGLTYNQLISLLGETTSVYLDTFFYNALYNYYEGENWFDFELDLQNQNYAGLVEAIENGQTITFMLRTPEDSQACFNIRAYVQNFSDGTSTYRQTGPILQVQTILPFSDIDFDGSQTIDFSDLTYLTNHWLETGDDLIGDIAPLGGDGIINMLDFAEFAKYW